MIKFGPSGNSDSFFAAGLSHTEDAAKYVRERGLDCYEYSFGRGVHMGEGKAISIGEAFAAEGIEISVHAPYYINFANPLEESAQILSIRARQRALFKADGRQTLCLSRGDAGQNVA